MSPASDRSSKSQRQAERALVVGYYEARLAELLERVREGFAGYDAGELDAFELDELIHRYKRAARELWKFCASLGGSNVHFVARTLEEWRGAGEEVDWWERGNPRHER